MDAADVIPVAAAAVLAASLLAVPGLLGPAPSPAATVSADGSGETAASGDILQGEFSRTLEGPAWVDIAYEVHRGMDWDRLAVNVTFEWNQRPDRHDRTQQWSCAYVGKKLVGRPLDAGAPSWLGCISFLRDGAIEADVRYGPANASLKVADPYHEADATPCCGWSWHNGILAPKDYETLLEDRNRTTVHMVAYAGGTPPDRIVVKARLPDTHASITTGPFEDTFTVFREDYASDLFVRVPSDYFRQEDAAYEMTLPDDGRATFFVHSPIVGQDLDAEEVGPWFERPTGERFSCCGTEATYLDGTYRFGYDKAQGRYADLPVLRGLRFEWNEGP